MTARFPKLGFKLAMRVLQSDLYAKLDDAERSECDALIKDGQTLCHCGPARCGAPKRSWCLDPATREGLTFPNRPVMPVADAHFDSLPSPVNTEKP